MTLPYRLVLAAILAATCSAASAQNSGVLDRPTLYRLDRTSTIERGCFPPCMCPMLETIPLTGTFRLSLISVGNVFDFYEVTGVRFKFESAAGEVTEITGSGTYAVSTIADLQRMNLTLVVGAEEPTDYHSDEVPGGAAFPKIRIPVSINGGFCHDTVLTLHARPARRLHVARDNLWWDGNEESPGTASDVVYGDLSSLRASAGAFDAATWACVADSSAGTSTPFIGAPPPGRGYWFLERAAGDRYDDFDAALVGSPDPGIASSGRDCP